MKKSLATSSRTKFLILSLRHTHCFKIWTRCQQWPSTPNT